MADHSPTYWPDEPQHQTHPDEDRFRAEIQERDYAPPLVAAARRDDAYIKSILCDEECPHGKLPGDRNLTCGCWERAA